MPMIGRAIVTHSAAVLFWAISFSALAQASWPNGQTVRIIVPFPGGASTLDSVVRTVTPEISKSLGSPVIVDNKPGAGTVIGVDATAKANDNLTVGAVANSFTVNQSLIKNLPYNTTRDLQPVVLMAKTANVLAVKSSLPVNNLKELIAYAKKNPGKLNYGSAGNGGISHLVPEMLKSETGIFMVHIPFKGSAPAFTDLIAGHVQFMAESVPQAANYAKQDKVKALAVTSAKRNPALPNTPTVIETGVANLEVVGFYGILAPKGTPPDVVNKLSQAFKETLESPEIQKKMIDQGADPAYLNADQFTKFLAAEMPRWAKAVKEAGAKLD